MIKNRVAVLLFSTALPVISLAASPVEQVQSWLEKMHRAAHTLNYEGTFVYGQNNKLSSMRIIHSVSSDTERERLISLDGSGREVIRNGDLVTCILPDSNSVVIEKTRPENQYPPAFPMKVGQLAHHYNLKLAGQGRVAGQTTQKLIFSPKDNLRYGHALWIDSKTGLLLKTHLLDERGVPVEQFMFTEIRFVKKIADTLLQSSVSSDSFTRYEAKEQQDSGVKEKNMDWKVVRLPAGFTQDMQRRHNMSTSAMPVQHLVYSDGLASVSVFIEKSKNDASNLVGGSRMGAVNAHGRALKNHHITVVGEVPQAAVKMIGESIKYLGQ